MTAAALVETGYLVAAAGCAGVGGACLVAQLAGRDRPGRSKGIWMFAGTALTALVVALWVTRWIAAGHLPVFGTYESALSLSAAVMVASWLWERGRGFRAGAGPVAAVVAAGLLAHGHGFDQAIYALTISERSWVVDVHAGLAWLAFGVLTTNAALSLRAVIGRGSQPAGRDALVVRTLEIGFVLHTGMMITGSLYKFLLFGKAWSFDPIETMGFAAWAAYGTLVHLVRFANWRGRRLAGWCLFLFVLLVVSYRVIVYFPSWSTYHILDMDLRLHVPG